MDLLSSFTGYEFFNDRTLVTVFSAPNYCGEFDNKGAVMTINPHLMCAFEIVQPDLGFKGVLMGLKKGTGAGGSSSPPLSSSPPSEVKQAKTKERGSGLYGWCRRWGLLLCLNFFLSNM